MLFLFIILFRLWGEEPHSYVKQWIKSIDKLNCKREIISVINYGNDSGEINYPERKGFCGPIAFDVDENEDIYIMEKPWLYKYRKDNQLLKKNIGAGNLDFKYYDKRLFFYKKNKIIILDSDNFKLIKEVLIPDTMTNRQGIGNVSFFEGNYLFIQDFKFDVFKRKLEYIYDLKNNIFSNKINNDSLFSPITKCKECELAFLKELTVGGSTPIHFIGQTDDYLSFNFVCSPIVRSHICKNETEQYYIMNKKNKDTWMLSFGDDPNIDYTPSRPFIFINDTTFIYQSLTGNRDGEYRNGSQEKLIYSKMHLKFNH